MSLHFEEDFMAREASPFFFFFPIHEAGYPADEKKLRVTLIF